MIATVTLNAALDVTYRAPVLSHGEPVRVEVVGMRAGGKGLNVAHVLRLLGDEVVAAGLTGGLRGAQIRRGLAAAGIVDELTEIATESRQTITVVSEDGFVAAYDERGPVVTGDEWASCLERCRQVFARCDSVALAGSVPPGLPEDAYALLVEEAHRAGVVVLLDGSGPHLVAGAAAGPDVVKINRRELSVWAGRPLPAVSDVLGCAEELRRKNGIGTLITTMGSAGTVVTHAGASLVARVPALTGNPVGAGDAFTAAWMHGAMRPESEPALAEALRFACAAAASAVESPTAGTLEPGRIGELESEIEIDELESGVGIDVGIGLTER